MFDGGLWDVQCCIHLACCVCVFSELGMLRLCYEQVFNESCGNTAATQIGRLIAKAFEDPFYLRMGFKPDCRLHADPTHHQPHTLKPAPPGVVTPPSGMQGAPPHQPEEEVDAQPEAPDDMEKETKTRKPPYRSMPVSNGQTSGGCRLWPQWLLVGAQLVFMCTLSQRTVRVTR